MHLPPWRTALFLSARSFRPGEQKAVASAQLYALKSPDEPCSWVAVASDLLAIFCISTHHNVPRIGASLDIQPEAYRDSRRHRIIGRRTCWFSWCANTGPIFCLLSSNPVGTPSQFDFSGNSTWVSNGKNPEQKYTGLPSKPLPGHRYFAPRIPYH